MTDTTVSMAASTRYTGKRFVRSRRFLRSIPWFAYFLVFFVLIELSVPDVREVLFSLGRYSLTWVEVLYLIASFVAMAELLRVSMPGIDNTREALFMAATFVVYLMLFMAGSMQTAVLHMFSNTEFLMVTLLSLAQVILAFIINARTLKRTVDMSSGVDTVDELHH